MFFDLKEIGL